MRKIFHSMTKVSIVLAMSAPAPIYGQEAGQDLPLCDSELILPCMLDDDTQTMMTAEIVADLPVCEATDELPCQVEADGTLMTQLRMEQEAEIAAAAAAAAQAEADAAAEAQAQAEAEAAAAAEAAEAAAAEEAARAAEEQAAAEAAAAEAAAQAEAEAQAAAEAQAEADAAAQALAEAEAAAAAEAEQQAAADAEAAAAAEAEALAAAEADAAAAEEQAAADAEAQLAAELEAAAQAELEAEMQAELDAQAQAEAEAEAAAQAAAEAATEEEAPEVADATTEELPPEEQTAAAEDEPQPKPEEMAEVGANAPAALEIDDPEIAEELAQIEAEIAAEAVEIPAEIAQEVEQAANEVAGLPVCTDEGPYPCLAEDGSVMSEEMAMALAEAEARAAEEAAQIEAQAEAEPAPVVENTEADADAGLSEETLASEVANEEAKPVETTAAASAVEEGDVEDEAVGTQTEVVSAQNVRKSNEEFAEAESTGGNRRNGLSNLEKILLLGVGAVVVGKLLDNGDKVVDNSGDRVTVQRPDGSYYVLRDDDALLRQDGNLVKTRTFDDGSTLTTVTKPNGEQVKTIRDATGRVLRRTRVLPDGREFLLFDDTVEVERIDVTELPRESAGTIELTTAQNDALGDALREELDGEFDRRFSLSQIRNIRAVRELVPVIDIEQVTFDTGSSAIKPEEAKKLAKLGVSIQRALRRNPGAVFLIEGHTDATGPATLNLRLSDRRAESLALALTEYFNVPPENLVVQGYGEAYLKVATLENERLNRRVAVREITKLIGADDILAMR